MTRLLQIPAHVRRAPLDPYAAIKAAKTEQLRREVSRSDAIRNAHVIINGMDELWDACLDNIKADPEYRAVLA